MDQRARQWIRELGNELEVLFPDQVPFCFCIPVGEVNPYSYLCHGIYHGMYWQQATGLVMLPTNKKSYHVSSAVAFHPLLITAASVFILGWSDT